MGALCFPPFCKNTFCTITFELKYIGWWFWVSWTMFSGSRNQLALVILIIGLSVCLSVCLPACLSLRPSCPLSINQSDCWSLSAFSWSVNRSALLSPARPCEALLSPARPCLVPLGPTYPCLALLSPAKSCFAPLSPALPRLALLSLVRPCLAPLYPVWSC